MSDTLFTGDNDHELLTGASTLITDLESKLAASEAARGKAEGAFFALERAHNAVKEKAERDIREWKDSYLIVLDQKQQAEADLATERERLDEVLAALQQYDENPPQLWKHPEGHWHYDGTRIGRGDTPRAAIDVARAKEQG